jgi:hypothetical protein
VRQRAVSQFGAAEHPPHLLNASRACQQSEFGVHGILAGFGHQEMLMTLRSDLGLMRDHQYLTALSKCAQ